jgi:hypothetical protein
MAYTTADLTGDGIMPLDIVNVLGESLPNVKWILPHAPVRPITINREQYPRHT